MGWRASDTRELVFSDATIPAENVLGQRGRGLHQFLTVLDGGRISVAALSVGLAMGAYDEALKYAKERQQFGRPIAKFQAIQFKLADMLMEIEHARLMVLKAAWEKDNGRDYVMTASLAKLYSGEVSRRVVNEAVQIHGGYGFMDEYPVSRMYRDQKINEIGEGTNEVQRLVIARLMGL
jgi:butyryl-CoA dehydrogenase